ncbi:MAG: hypothetical protein IH594_18450, partial [Bacteroidales bacterium]|nr:hypothetical protein [Bacteroidales bacterium]
MKFYDKKLWCVCLILLGCITASSQSVKDEQFKNPPLSFRPGVLWDWMGGMVSKEGITKDLEALAAQGIGKVLLMQMPDQCPYPRQWSYREYPGKVRILSDEWFDMLNYAIGECDRIGITMGSFACPGWGHVGGPWVPKDKGTKKLALTSVKVNGPLLLDMNLPKPAPAPVGGGGNTIPEWNYAYKLMPEARENYFHDEIVLAYPDPEVSGTIQLNKVIDVTNNFNTNGKLTWEVPEGDWIITRVCLVSQNGINHPAPPEASGLEVDRMDPDAVRIVFDGMIGRILREAREKGYKSFNAYETDSYESGYQDYGLDFRQEFKKRRGYDCAPWLPAWSFQLSTILKQEPDPDQTLSMISKPVVIGSEDLTTRFRLDMMRTISELWEERFHGTLQQLADEHQITWMTEPYFLVPLDWTTIGGISTMPGSEFWVGEEGKIRSAIGNAPEIAALYNRKIAWAEAFTAEAHHSAWRNDPWMLKRSGDAAFASGINLLYMHGFVHNPFPDKYQPGLTMGYWGSQLSRHQTWWNYSGAWHRYLSRCQYMLQQGDPVFHVLKYPGSFNPMPVTSQGPYKIAQLTDELLLNKLSVREGKLVLPHGAEFLALHLTGEALRPEALVKIKALVEEGATLIGDPPSNKSASLENYPECDLQVAGLIEKIWGQPFQGKTSGVRKFGKGRVLYGISLEEGMKKIGQEPDFSYETLSGISSSNLIWHQRRTDSMKFWFVSNQENDKISVNANFEVSGLQPEWWDPVDGSVRNLPEFDFKDGRTII